MIEEACFRMNGEEEEVTILQFCKSLPMLLSSLFLPQGMTIDYTGQVQPTFTAGSITVIVVPLTSIADQLKMECSRLGLSAVVGGEVVAHWSCLNF